MTAPHAPSSEFLRKLNRVAFGFLLLLNLAALYQLIYCLTHVGRMGEYFLNNAGLSLALCLLLLWGIRLRGERRIQFFFAALIGTLFVYTAEGLALTGKLGAQPNRAELAAKRGQPYDARTPLQVIDDARLEGDALSFAFSPSEWFDYRRLEPETFANIFPLGGLSNTPTLLCNEGGEYALFTADAQGFNNGEADLAAPLARVLIGDSFTMGDCVAPEQNIAGHLRAALPGGVRNFGVRGSGPLFQLAALSEYAAPLRPKRVYWLYYEANDLDDLPREMADALLIRYLREPGFSQNLRDRQEEIDGVLGRFFALSEEKIRSRAQPQSKGLKQVGKFLRLTALKQALGIRLFPPEAPMAPEEGLIEILQAAQQRTAAWGGEMILVYLPSAERAFDQTPSHDYHRARLLQAAQAMALTVLDFTPQLQQETEPERLFPLGLPGHFNGQGYAAVAQMIAAYEKRQVGQTAQAAP
ncbi:hypothetical protein [Magnetofaba australis]|uniref:SGNH hydrolase-type esterase domain-containing protein n=1 Tax=Magnetofaba australis IT-1 TaxID=1434232 RepID=A0A1Y2K1C0_9PROT|nr:hypothetical protein [Magnetofaba australis]OSM01831.1 hypothetical protein MAIT1_01876 [Magnetofaba australis IT-1]